jgi:hypothetical protein
MDSIYRELHSARGKQRPMENRQQENYICARGLRSPKRRLMVEEKAIRMRDIQVRRRGRMLPEADECCYILEAQNGLAFIIFLTSDDKGNAPHIWRCRFCPATCERIAFTAAE